ncbi:uncharacterized protein CTHT_0036550 [Thermochaetoides thermophila DSM 1495]|uniref:Apple domain-containing protein n=1 Tax=Chaetomium thermophilum (strain DSM 1495 / CBS 144.50 / IMI 039719) TaxID=759272 RepID=G0S7E3_CHATD|nr:hypothetical protein CTHT_0036550 [Thermochaetoides thermophila DSM 1495]EGS21787.1 hypothetical protein CTHT_0036550 [Thermochaetoides thermophila DSM 1495]
MVQNFAPTFQDCLNQCAATTGCAALSFDPSQEFGFKNCYLKTMVTNSSAVAADRRTDSAMAGGGMLPNLPANPGQPSSDPGVSIIPLPSSTVGSAAGNGVVFFTPPPGSSTGVSSTVEPSLSTADASVTQSPSTTALPSFFLPGPTLAPTSSSGTAVPETASPETRETSPSMAWIAAPVVGGIAAVALIAVTFIILKRWRRGHGKGKKSGGYQSPGFFTTWLPSSWTSSEDGNRRGNKRMTEISSGRKNGDALVSVRNSVAEFLTGRPMGMERLEDIEEGGRTGPNTSGAGTGAGAGTSSGGNQNSNMPIFVIKNGRKELRKSFNGLGQNEWTG